MRAMTYSLRRVNTRLPIRLRSYRWAQMLSCIRHFTPSWVRTEVAGCLRQYFIVKVWRPTLAPWRSAWERNTWCSRILALHLAQRYTTAGRFLAARSHKKTIARPWRLVDSLGILSWALTSPHYGFRRDEPLPKLRRPREDCRSCWRSGSKRRGAVVCWIAPSASRVSLERELAALRRPGR
jgi:hypothetical protein